VRTVETRELLWARDTDAAGGLRTKDDHTAQLRYGFCFLWKPLQLFEGGVHEESEKCLSLSELLSTEGDQLLSGAADEYAVVPDLSMHVAVQAVHDVAAKGIRWW